VANVTRKSSQSDASYRVENTTRNLWFISLQLDVQQNNNSNICINIHTHHARTSVAGNPKSVNFSANSLRVLALLFVT